jgi:hypothetical protein
VTRISEKLLSDTDIHIVMLHKKLKMWGGKFICPMNAVHFKGYWHLQEFVSPFVILWYSCFELCLFC